MVRSLALVFACWLLMSCGTSHVSTADPESGSAEVEVRQASDQFWSIRGRGDAVSLAARFTETGTFGVPGLPDAEGRSAVGELLQKRFAKTRITDFKVHRREIDVSGDSAFELGWFSEVSHYGEDDPMRMEGRYVIVWKLERDSQWLVHRTFYNFSSAMPIDPPPN